MIKRAISRIGRPVWFIFRVFLVFSFISISIVFIDIKWQGPLGFYPRVEISPYFDWSPWNFLGGLVGSIFVLSFHFIFFYKRNKGVPLNNLWFSTKGLKTLEIPIQPSDIWEIVLPRLKRMKGYRLLSEDRMLMKIRAVSKSYLFFPGKTLEIKILGNKMNSHASTIAITSCPSWPLTLVDLGSNLKNARELASKVFEWCSMKEGSACCAENADSEGS